MSKLSRENLPIKVKFLEIGSRIKQIRETININQKDFLEKLELPQRLATLSSWENGISEPGFTLLSKIGRVFGVNQNWLLNGEGEMFLRDDQLKSERIDPEKSYSITERQIQDITNMLRKTPPAATIVYSLFNRRMGLPDYRENSIERRVVRNNREIKGSD